MRADERRSSTVGAAPIGRSLLPHSCAALAYVFIYVCKCQVNADASPDIHRLWERTAELQVHGRQRQKCIKPFIFATRLPRGAHRIGFIIKLAFQRASPFVMLNTWRCTYLLRGDVGARFYRNSCLNLANYPLMRLR